MVIHTIGHSNRSWEEFADLLAEAAIETLVDVRKLPGSARNPQFNEEVLAQELPRVGITYRRVAPLTGRRNVSKTIPFEVNGNWRNRSFHNYADHALSGEFALALQELRDAASSEVTAIMCSEAVWWRCHRRIIADHLIAAGEDVRHIMGPGQIMQATLNDGAVIGEDKKVHYPKISEE
ncbi:DUF488 domain-containing protein [Corynebacterium sp. A21]|uniref:DUF488 domain-containing protein n=1 Tax=Corynebacterium sp. A21 TaxID=3457318 RepID=UPI003FD5A381